MNDIILKDADGNTVAKLTAISYKISSKIPLYVMGHAKAEIKREQTIVGSMTSTELIPEISGGKIEIIFDKPDPIYDVKRIEIRDVDILQSDYNVAFVSKCAIIIESAAICDCGGTKTRTPHSSWCPLSGAGRG